MNESDIIEVVKLLNRGIKHEDWDEVVEARSYLEEFLEELDDEEDDYNDDDSEEDELDDVELR